MGLWPNTNGVVDAPERLNRLRIMARSYCCKLRRVIRLMILGVTFAATSAHAEAMLEVVPKSIAAATIEKSETMSARLRLRAPAEATLRNVRVTSISNDGISVEFASNGTAAGIDAIAPNDEQLWSLRLTLSRPLAKKAEVIFEVTMNEDPEAEGEKTVRRHLYVILQIESPSAGLLTSLVDMEIKGGDGIVSRQRPGTVHVVFKNQRDLSVQITNLRWFGPSFIELRAADAGCNTDAAPAAQTASHRLGPYEQVIVPILVCPREQIVPGKYSLLATASVAAGGAPLTVLSASREIQVGVLGESELLNLLGVPSLLLLPGFLFLITWRILGSLRGTPLAGGFELKPKEAEFWAVAIALSLGFAFLYPLVTELVLPEGQRDYLVAYGLRDLVFVYSAAIVLGMFGYGCWRLIATLQAAYKARQLSRSVPLAGDSAIAILAKLALARGEIELPIVHLKGTQPDLELFELHPWTTADEVWVVPPIHLKMKDRFASADESRDAYNALQRVTTAQGVDAAATSQIINDGKSKGWWKVDWDVVGAVNGPTSVMQDAVISLHQQGRLVIEAP